jgi:hydroxypyruvate isomerase
VINFGNTSAPPYSRRTDITDIITVVPTPLPDRIQALISLVQASSLSKKRQQNLVEELKEAAKKFQKRDLHHGIEELREFQKKVRKEIGDAALADQLIQAAQNIIEKAKAQTGDND